MEKIQAELLSSGSVIPHVHLDGPEVIQEHPLHTWKGKAGMQKIVVGTCSSSADEEGLNHPGIQWQGRGNIPWEVITFRVFITSLESWWSTAWRQPGAPCPTWPRWAMSMCKADTHVPVVCHHCDFPRLFRAPPCPSPLPTCRCHFASPLPLISAAICIFIIN